MAGYRVLKSAGRRIDDIFLHSLGTWGEAQASRYIGGLFDRFEAIASRRVPWRAIPRELGVDGFYCRYEHHYIYWRILPDDTLGIVTVLHERMHQIDRFRNDAPN